MGAIRTITGKGENPKYIVVTNNWRMEMILEKSHHLTSWDSSFLVLFSLFNLRMTGKYLIILVRNIGRVNKNKIHWLPHAVLCFTSFAFTFHWWITFTLEESLIIWSCNEFHLLRIFINLGYIPFPAFEIRGNSKIICVCDATTQRWRNDVLLLGLGHSKAWN